MRSASANTASMSCSTISNVPAFGRRANQRRARARFPRGSCRRSVRRASKVDASVASAMPRSSARCSGIAQASRLVSSRRFARPIDSRICVGAAVDRARTEPSIAHTRRRARRAPRNAGCRRRESPANTLVDWKLRASPRRAIACGGMPDMSTPPRRRVRRSLACGPRRDRRASTCPRRSDRSARDARRVRSTRSTPRRISRRAEAFRDPMEFERGGHRAVRATRVRSAATRSARRSAIDHGSQRSSVEREAGEMRQRRRRCRRTASRRRFRSR